MTMPIPDYLNLPDPNDPRSIEHHKTAVLSYFNRFLDLANSALTTSTMKATELFGLLGGPRDRSVHAMNTRYLVKVFLKENQIPAQEESSAPDESRDKDLNVEWVANCGLFVKLPEAEVRILKMGPAGVPKSTSTSRSRYYSSNQMLLALDQSNGGRRSHADPPLVLVLLWDVDAEFKYLGLEVACPRAVSKDGNVDCFWVEKWAASKSAGQLEDAEITGADTDLDEIVATKPSPARASKMKS